MCRTANGRPYNFYHRRRDKLKFENHPQLDMDNPSEIWFNIPIMG